MSFINFTVNQLIQTVPLDGSTSKIERIVWVSPDNNYVYLIDMDNPQSWCLRDTEELRANLAEGIMYFLTHDPYSQPYILLDEDLNDRQRSYLEEVWPKMRDLLQADGGTAVFDKKRRAQLIEELGLTRKVVNRVLPLYFHSGGLPVAIVPQDHKKGNLAGNNPGGRYPQQEDVCRLTNEIKKLMLRGYSEFYENGNALTVSEAWRSTMAKYFNNGFELSPEGVRVPILKPLNERPTYDQFLRVCHYPRDVEKVSTKRNSRSFSELNLAPRPGSANRMAFGPGSYSLIDSTPLTVALVSSLDRSRVLMAVTLYLMKDLFSMLITGFSLGLEEHSWLAQMGCIMNSVEDKVAFCAQYGIHIKPEDWPCHHLPQILVGDRGELMSKNGFNLVNLLNVDICNNPPYFPVFKAAVELDFRLLEDHIITKLPGGGKRAKRPNKDYRGLPCLTLHELRYLIIHWILAYNKAHWQAKYARDEWQIADNVDLVPLKLWNWGIQNRSGILRTASPQMVYQALLPRDTGSISRQGILFKKRRYQVDVDSLRDEERKWYFAASNQRESVTIAYDSRSTRHVYLCLPPDRARPEIPRWIRCRLLDREVALQDRDWQEVADYDAFRGKQERRAKHTWDQDLANVTAHVIALLQDAEPKAEQDRLAAGVTKTSLEANKRIYHTIEKVMERITDLTILDQWFDPQPFSPAELTETQPDTDTQPTVRRDYSAAIQAVFTDSITGVMNEEANNEENQ